MQSSDACIAFILHLSYTLLEMKKQAGFSLLEVLIALGITSIFLVGLLRLQISSTRMIQNTSFNFSALLVAIEKIEAIKDKQIAGRSTEETENFTVTVYREKEILKEGSLDKLTVAVFSGETGGAEKEKLAELSWYDFKSIKF